MSNPILSVQNLTTQLQINKTPYTVVENLSFDLYPGKTLALVGESGCGKSMTALSILRILPQPLALHPKGKVLYRGENLIDLPEKRMRKVRGSSIAMIFQDPTGALNPVYTIGDQLIEVAQLHLEKYGDEATALAIKALRDVGIPSPEARIYDYPHQLSGGMRQRVMIAMALMCEPDVLIADEPTTALDVTIQAQVLDLMRDLQQRKGMALLLITHDMGVVAEMADDVIVMYASQGVERGPVVEIFDNMSHPYTQGLFRSRPGPDTPHGVKLNAIKGAVPPLTRYPEGCRFHPRCQFCMNKCKEGEVQDLPVKNREDHIAKCWLWDGSVESGEKLKHEQAKEFIKS
ncbi:MAG: ABC transporter ATP-binding protein [Chlamydiota bacterium]|nr:ABC transporter ATP-binding protein [Chlamydiota bacterium]